MIQANSACRFCVFACALIWFVLCAIIWAVMRVCERCGAPSSWRERFYSFSAKTFCRLLMRAFSAIITFHNLCVHSRLSLPTRPDRGSRAPPSLIVLCEAVFMSASACLCILHLKFRENKPTKHSICVANHTSYFDAIVLGINNSFALVLFIASQCLRLPLV